MVEIVNRLRRKGLLERWTVKGKSSLEITDAGDQVLVKALSKLLLNETISSLGTERIKRLMEDLMPLRQAAMQQLGLIDQGEVRLQQAWRQTGQFAGVAAGVSTESMEYCPRVVLFSS